MQVILPGSDYQLDSFHHTVVQRLVFVRGVRSSTGQLRVDNDGTTNEEVLEVLVHRLNHLQLQKPCKETAMAITKLEEAQHWLNYRKAVPGEEG